MDASNPRRISKWKKPLYLFNDVKERYVAARRLGIDIGFYEITGTDSKNILSIYIPII